MKRPDHIATIRRNLLDGSPSTSEARSALDALETEVRRLRLAARHARAIYLSGQLDKYPTSDAGPEYKLWRLVRTAKDKKEEGQ